jgi:hypothetical protein
MVPHQIVLDLHAVEKLLITPYSCLILSHIRYINNKNYVTLDNDADVAKTAAILNGKPDFQSNFDSASKLNVLYPVKALFFNVSDLESIKMELEYHNKSLRGLIHSVKLFFSKQHTTEGHVKSSSLQNRPETIFYSLEKLLFCEKITALSLWILIVKLGDDRCQLFNYY